MEALIYSSPRQAHDMTHNIFSRLPDAPTTEEEFLTLLSRPGLRIERIVSTGQASPPDFWYEQQQSEWILLLSGTARLRFADESEPRPLTAGDYLLIEPQRRHRVEWTDPQQNTVWLAIHYELPES